MAIAFLGSGYASKTLGSSHSASITVPANTDFLVVVGYSVGLNVNNPTAPTAGAVAGNSMTAVAQTPSGDQDTGWVKMFFYYSPPTGSQTVAVSGGGGTIIETAYSWAAYSGVAQSGQPDSSGKQDNATTAALALATTVVTADSWVVCGFANQGTVSSYTNGTERDFDVPNGGFGTADSNAAVSAGSYTITVNQTSQECSGVVASFSPAISTENSFLAFM